MIIAAHKSHFVIKSNEVKRSAVSLFCSTTRGQASLPLVKPLCLFWMLLLDERQLLGQDDTNASLNSWTRRVFMDSDEDMSVGGEATFP